MVRTAPADQSGHMNPPDAETPSSDTGLPAPGEPRDNGPRDNGPRVSRDEVRDLARLRRSRGDRKVAGVAGGVARHLDIDPLLVRVGFVVLTFFGGGGLILYGVAWLVVPEEHSERAVVRLDDGVRSVALILAGVISLVSVLGDAIGGGFPWPLLIVGAIVLGVIATKESLRPGGPTHPWLRGPATPPPGTPDATGSASPSTAAYPGYRPGPPPYVVDRRKRGPVLFFLTLALALLGAGVLGTIELAGVDVPVSAYPATVLAACGLMLVVSAFYGRGGGLTLVGLVAALVTGLMTAAPDLSAGRVSAQPATAAGLESSYTVGAGEIIVNLTSIDDLDELDDQTLRLEARFGRIAVAVPDEGLDVVVVTEIEGGGESRLFGDRRNESFEATYDGGEDVPVLTIDAEVLFGEITVDAEEVQR